MNPLTKSERGFWNTHFQMFQVWQKIVQHHAEISDIQYVTYFKLSSGQKIGSTVYNLLNLMTTINWPLSWTWLSNSKSEISSTVLNFVFSLIFIFETGRITFCKTGSVLKQFWIRTSDCFSYHVIDIICK